MGGDQRVFWVFYLLFLLQPLFLHGFHLTAGFCRIFGESEWDCGANRVDSAGFGSVSPELRGTGAGQHGAGRAGMYWGCLEAAGSRDEDEEGLPAAALLAAGSAQLSPG